MYLKRMEVSGFKSFAKKTEFQFEDGITAIVGPNGSGKSNVADAMRWVLGEQSAKQLRSSNMQDVIFAGTESRRAQGYAYVSMVFDNSDHALPLEFEEVTIGRRVYRSGESEYLINNSSCRRKDIQELFYDTGIGKEGYSIIGQGQIDKILSGKPEDRRELFDEAAGIVKYKKRKYQAVSRLAKEEESLVRIEDILRELEQREKPLKDQSEKARIYLKLYDQLKIQEVNDFLVEEEVSRQELADVTKSVEDSRIQLEEGKNKVQEVKFRYEAVSQNNQTLEQEVDQLHQDLQTGRDQSAALRAEAEVLEAQVRADQNMIALHEEQEQAYRSRLDAGMDDANKLAAQVSEQAALCQELQEDGEEILQEITQISQNINKAERELEDKRILEEKLAERRSVYRVNQQKFLTIAQQRERQYASLQGRKLEFKGLQSQLKESMKDKQAEVKSLQEKIKAAKEDWRRLLEEIDSLKQNYDDALAAVGLKHQELQRTQARLTTLQNIAERYEGFGGGVRNIMNQKDRFKGIYGVLADLISVDARYETAIETALGGAMQNVVCDDERTTKACIQYLKDNKGGRVTFLPVTTVKAKGSFREQDALRQKGVCGTADSLVRTDERYRDIIKSLLGKILVVDSMDHALAIASHYHYSFRIVTLDGESLNAGGSISGGAFKNKSTLLSRRRELEELEQNLALCKAAYERALTKRNLERNTLEEKQAEQGKQREIQQELSLAWNTLELSMAQLKDQRDSVKNELEQVDKDMVLLQAEQTDTVKDQKKVEKNAAEIEKEYEDCREQIGYLEESIAEFRSSLECAQEELKDNQIDMAARKAGLDHLKENLDRISSDQDQLREEIREQAGLRQALTDALDKKRDRIAASVLEGEALSQILEEKAGQLEERQKARAGLQKELQTLFQEQNSLSDLVRDLDKEVIRLENRKNHLEELLDQKAGHLWEAYELTPSKAEAYRLNPMPPRQEMRISIQQLKAQIRKLGNINPNAVEEYAELEERLVFMRTQHDDLVHARENLKLLIDQLNRSMEKQFKDKFKEIKREFNKVFKELFGGGTGSLELQEEGNDLESGILINVQPPGKKLQNMMQLSGGEKALTAISLLFAILNLKPSPFCMLDEIEAALDDSNVDRYAAYLGRLKQDTQFIVITHRRGTMLIADQLYGITMQEKGVSSLVSVDLTDAVTE